MTDDRIRNWLTKNVRVTNHPMATLTFAMVHLEAAVVLLKFLYEYSEFIGLELGQKRSWRLLDEMARGYLQPCACCLSCHYT